MKNGPQKTLFIYQTDVDPTIMSRKLVKCHSFSSLTLLARRNQCRRKKNRLKERKKEENEKLPRIDKIASKFTRSIMDGSCEMGKKNKKRPSHHFEVVRPSHTLKETQKSVSFTRRDSSNSDNIRMNVHVSEVSNSPLTPSLFNESSGDRKFVTKLVESSSSCKLPPIRPQTGPLRKTSSFRCTRRGRECKNRVYMIKYDEFGTPVKGSRRSKGEGKNGRERDSTSLPKQNSLSSKFRYEDSNEEHRTEIDEEDHDPECFRTPPKQKLKSLQFTTKPPLKHSKSFRSPKSREKMKTKKQKKKKNKKPALLKRANSFNVKYALKKLKSSEERVLRMEKLDRRCRKNWRKRRILDSSKTFLKSREMDNIESAEHLTDD